MKRLGAFVAAWLLAVSAWAVRVAPDHRAIRYVGRFTEDHRFGWSGRGMFRNRQLKHDQAATLPKIFGQTLLR